MWCTDGELLSFFKKLFISSNPLRFWNERFPVMAWLSEEGQVALEREVAREAVWEALWFMKAFKAPGPDGFQLFFFKHFRHILREDVSKVVQEAFSSGTFDTRLTNTLIVPIPKVDVPMRLAQFRPISLCNVVYKL